MKTLSFLFLLFFFISYSNSEIDFTIESSTKLSEDNFFENNLHTSSDSLLQTHTINSLSKEQSAILLQACTVFQKAKNCFEKSKNILGAIFCADKWEDPSREERHKLIEYHFISQEEYDIGRMAYNQKKQICKEKAESEGSWFIEQKLIEYRCFRPIALDYMDSIIERFNCNSIAPVHSL